MSEPFGSADPAAEILPYLTDEIPDRSVVPEITSVAPEITSAAPEITSASAAPEITSASAVSQITSAASKIEDGEGSSKIPDGELVAKIPDGGVGAKTVQRTSPLEDVLAEHSVCGRIGVSDELSFTAAKLRLQAMLFHNMNVGNSGIMHFLSPGPVFGLIVFKDFLHACVGVFSHCGKSSAEFVGLDGPSVGQLSFHSCILEFGGASEGNPGQSGAGAVLRAEYGSAVYGLREGVGIATIDVAEYRAVILGLKYALEKGYKHIRVKGYSKCVCMQVQGFWKPKNQNMAELCQEARELKEKFMSFDINHVLRADNPDADVQANRAINLQDGQVEVDLNGE